MTLAALLLVVAGTSSTPATHFDISALFVRGKAAGSGEVAVSFVPRDPDVRVNEYPAPRLKLDPEQKVLAEKPFTAAPPPPPGQPAYLDLAFPVVFPVTVSGPSYVAVKGTLTYFYCSKRDGWCRKGTVDLEIPVKGH